VTPDPALVRQIEADTATGWPAAQTGEVDGWAVHLGKGQVGRTNSCWPLSWTGSSLEHSVAAVEALYREAGLPTRYKVTDVGCEPPGLADHLARRGYRAESRVHVMTRQSAPMNRDPGVELSAKVTPAFLETVGETGVTPLDGQERADILARVPTPSAFAQLAVDGVCAAVGLCMFTGRSAGIGAMRTRPAFQRRGLARRIVSTLISAAHTGGYRLIWLQVETDNAPAVNLYQAFGFERLYGYVTWRRDLGTA
jgi:N-acetylglutamate synthase